MLGEISKDFYCTRSKSPVLSCSESALCKMQGWKCGYRHRKYPTPEQFKEEYGIDYPDDGAVYEADIDQGNKPTWIIASYWTAKKMGKRHIICACTPWGMPPSDWRPE
ncbi:MAG: hypothetical protein FWD36_03205 [Treponema sp.]|nr:hypothetical protein [Treponema sp.]